MIRKVALSCDRSLLANQYLSAIVNVNLIDVDLMVCFELRIALASALLLAAAGASPAAGSLFECEPSSGLTPALPCFTLTMGSRGHAA